MAFVKLHGTILDSSVWAEPHPIRIVWITMLAMADEDGIVQASVGGLARRAVVSIEECRTALDRFLGPDPDSRDGTTGERITKVPGGWLVLNHAQYREKRTEAQIATAERVARHRAKKRMVDAVTRNDVSHGNGFPPSEAEAEAEGTSSAATADVTHIQAEERYARARAETLRELKDLKSRMADARRQP